MKTELFDALKKQGFEGEIVYDSISLALYATDASAYREIPKAIVFPKNESDIQKLILVANKTGNGIIPRTAGTSLAGQVVGNGIVADVSKNLTQILEVNVEEHWVKVQPGVVLDELNIFLKPYGLFFGPETSTSNRCMIGGMVGNNACGAHSLIYGSTRDHLLEVKGFLSDGSEVEFKSVNKDEFIHKCNGNSLENKLYRHIHEVLSNDKNQLEIEKEYPETELKRRNSGYALDLLLRSNVYRSNETDFNFCNLIAGSEGTLMFITEIKLNLVPLPPPIKGVICVHFETLEEALEANLIALKYKPDAIELIDSVILNCTKDSIEQRKNRFFVSGEPGAILVIEFAKNTREEIESIKQKLEAELVLSKMGYYYPLLFGSDISKVWALRKAALGLLSNIPGDAKPVSLVEDTAVIPNKLPAYIAEFKEMLSSFGLTSVYHAHIATGELHLRPILNLKDKNDLIKFRKVAEQTALLVKKYKGSLSGEHGDGRLRGEFIPLIIGEHNFSLCKEVKKNWDAKGIFNPGKITNTPPMDQQLRHDVNKSDCEIKTYFDFSDSQGFMRHIERCNGSADCRKTEIIGGTMCPSFMATRNEMHSTRGRANVLREFIGAKGMVNNFDHKEIKEVLDLCLSCKACKAECPSNVDMTKLKAEFLQHFYDIHGVPLRSKLIGYMPMFYMYAVNFSSIYNFAVSNKTLSQLIKWVIGFAPLRNIPLVSSLTVSKWCKKNLEKLNSELKNPKKEVYIFIDEFTNYTDAELGITSIKLLNKLGYKVFLLPFNNSGRTFLSKGLVKQAQKQMFTYVNICKTLNIQGKPILGIEPSAILTFRDELLDLMPDSLKVTAKEISKNAYLIEVFLAKEAEIGKIDPSYFNQNTLEISLHGHCYQKALSTTAPIKAILALPANYSVTELPTGCCGMAGSFGFEKEHYDISMKVGNLVLFPAIRKLSVNTIIAASGTSCRQQIEEGTGRKAQHPIEILYNALNLQM